MPHYHVTVQMTCRQTFLVEADTPEQAQQSYGDGQPGDFEHDEPQVLSTKQVYLDDQGAVTDQANLFT